ncbi:MAG TPA: hypothetical protein VIU34_36110 [Steroidobacter sp.]
MIAGASAIVDELSVDISLEYYLEERALAIALAMASTPEQQAKVEHLLSLRVELMERRQAHSKEATAQRHAPGLSRQEMDASVKGLYMEQGTSEDVLRVHARTHIASVLVSKRLGLALMPADFAQSAREMLAHEESFAGAWIAAVGDPSFVDEMVKMLWP